MRWNLDGVNLIPIVRSDKEKVLLGVIPIMALNRIADSKDPNQAGYQPPALPTPLPSTARRGSLMRGVSPPPHSARDSAPPPLLAERRGSVSRGAAPPPQPTNNRRGSVERRGSVGKGVQPPGVGLMPAVPAALLAKFGHITGPESAPLVEGDASSLPDADTESEDDNDYESHPRYCPVRDEEMVDLLYTNDGKLRDGVDLAPLTVTENTKLARVAYLLRMVGAACICVIDEGALTGVLTRITLFRVEALINRGETETQKTLHLRDEAIRTSLTDQSEALSKLITLRRNSSAPSFLSMMRQGLRRSRKDSVTARHLRESKESLDRDSKEKLEVESDDAPSGAAAHNPAAHIHPRLPAP
mmetsp:Transcript_82524/g.164526  ORF Transcript_82524/g.164526 Transcript_82524/m.164526 type:complete len:358 (-) Transcript_82524:45-1118(-)